MAKRGRKPKGCVVEDLDSVLRRDIDLAIDSEAGESSRSIYNRFGLAQREINIRTFRQYVSDRRKEHKSRQPVTKVGLGDAPTLEELRVRCHIGILECLQSGETKAYELASILARIQDADKIEIQRDADQRAQEMHDIKVEQLSKDLRKGIDEATDGGNKTLTRENVYEMIDNIMRGAA